jgi:hypothetical protein
MVKGMNAVTADAKYEWAHVGYDVLVEVARQPHGLVNYDDIAEELQAITGIRTSAPTPQWIDSPLMLVAEMCVRNEEPQLTALVVSADSLQVGDGFAVTYAIAGQPLPRNLQRAAADLRTECYDHFSRREAVGWNRTKLTGRTGTLRTTPVRAALKPRVEAAPSKVCARCRLELLPSGHCGYCD